MFNTSRDLQSARSSLSGTDSHGRSKFGYEYFSVTDLSGARRFNDGFHHPIYLVVVHRQLEFYLGQEVDHVLCPSIEFSVALLTPEALDLCHGNALNPYFSQCRSHIVELEGFDDGDDHFHVGKLL